MMGLSIDRDKVIKGLEGIYRCVSPVVHTCGDCPYQDNHVECKRRAVSDAIALLKEQEPRILDWDEIKNYPVVYGEFRDVKEIYPLIITVDDWGRCLSWNPGINVSDEFLLVVSDEEDRKNTRCWDKVPTDEQRLGVKWND